MRIFVANCAMALLACAFPGCGPNSGVADVHTDVELEARFLYGGGNAPSDASAPSSHFLLPGDLNNDSVSDVIVGCDYYRNQCELSAYSGSNGSLIWQKTKEDIGGSFDRVSMISDVNRDGFLDVYLARSFSPKMYFISGKDGQVIARHEAPDEVDHVVGSRPVSSGDFNADGNVELAFRGDPLLIHRFSVDPFSYDGTTEIFPHQEHSTRIALSNIRDENRDGISDHLVCRSLQSSHKDEEYQWEMNVMSGKDFTSLRTFITERERIGGSHGYAMMGDVNGDGQDDFAFGSGQGATADTRRSVIRVFSGSDGSFIWEINGSQFDGVAIVPTGVDVPQPSSDWTPPPGVKKAEYDFDFHGQFRSIPDISGDQISDLAMIHLDHRKIYVFSAVDGSFLKSIDLRDDQSFFGTDFAVLDKLDSANGWGLAVMTKRESSKKPFLTILNVD